ncbi:hypothetical protein Glove_606g159 [Diversispora epigaea]|uniref:Histone-lysine N-methyltransferase SET5 n=1 Tax=Diversispora epigaea TaxID=1348612 RepID=A0A397GBI9_9GLOM|nr:hypothetical protein Glove_606g159 [Diversispora epigaea]
MCKFPSRPWDIRNQERCTEESLASVQKLLEKITGKSIKVALVRFPDVSQEHEFGIVATKDIKKGTILLEEKPFISIHTPGQQQCDFCNKPINSKKIYGFRNSLLIVLKIFAIAKQRDICPLDIEEIKHLFPFQHSTAWFQHGKPDCNLFNSMTGTGQLYPIISLFNHHCDPNSSHTNDVSRAIQPKAIRNIKKENKYLLITWITQGMTLVCSVTHPAVLSARQTLETTYVFRCRCSVCESSSY